MVWEKDTERLDDKKWKKSTHLNPNSNYITKMQKDVFDLKIGKNIYQVDYDHKTGIFTQEECIESKDTVIVCGLHSLYNNNSNLNIFFIQQIQMIVIIKNHFPVGVSMQHIKTVFLTFFFFSTFLCKQYGKKTQCFFFLLNMFAQKVSKLKL